MPVGRVQRVDVNRDYAAIVRNGRKYHAPLREMETSARVPDAPVHFDVKRESGVETAANVRLRRGTRTSRRRFGDLTGAHVPGDKVGSTSHDGRGVDVSAQPLAVARAWADAIGRGDTDGALSLYTPDADLHPVSGTIRGRRRLGAMLETIAGFAHGIDPRVRGLDRFVEVGWSSPDEQVITHLIVDHGQIREQWMEEDAADTPETTTTGPISVVRRGAVPDDVVDYARDKVARAMEFSGGRDNGAVVKLALGTNPAMGHPASAKVSIDLDGSIVRAHVAAETLLEAIDLLEERICRRIERQTDHPHHTTRRPAPNAWRHGDLPTQRPDFYDRPVGERELVCHKTFAPSDMTVEEAVFDMEILDYHFLLFRESGTGADAVLWHDDDLLHLRAAGSDGPPDTGTTGVAVDAREVPVSSARDALERLDACGERFIFFRNLTTGDGNVVYRRYDGHYGMVTPAG
jgi:ribosome-associated translation inhibitor RaiA